MCGIIGYIGKQNNPTLGLEALKRLEYRGYDSAGLAYYDTARGKVVRHRAVGRISALGEKLKGEEPKGSPFILHTRWATHGAPSAKNAHPHTDCTRTFFVAHNGIVENYQALKTGLIKKGHTFASDTDTEVLAHLIEQHFDGNLLVAVRRALRQVRGTYGLVVISSHVPDELIAARMGSPLLVGVGDDEYFVASDPAGILAHTAKAVYLEDGEVVQLTAGGMVVRDANNNTREPDISGIEWTLEEAQKGGHPHFMLKEILGQPDSLRDTMRGRLLPKDGTVKLGGLEGVEGKLRAIKKLHIVACGTAYYAGLVGKYILEEYAGIPTEVELASEFRYRKPLLGPGSAVLAISQSGETADTIAALHEAKQKGALTLGIVNVVGSTIARDTDAGVYNHAGPEIGVASTKAFTSQLVVLAMFSVLLGRQRDMSLTTGKRIVEELQRIPAHIERILRTRNRIEQYAKTYASARNALYLGRKYNYPIALEGALKLKEISYIHAEGYAGGETKHGPIAMVDKRFPSVIIAPKDSVHEKILSNAEEIKARGGPLLVLTTSGNARIRPLTKDILYIPKTLEMLTPLLSVVPLQLLSYYVGVAKGYDVDKPRNLAKSVTVE
jgi:glutamine---fructose-6-phosphate transaminase (isomerizing)